MALFATFIWKLNNFNEIKKIYLLRFCFIHICIYIYINRNMRIYMHMYDNNLKIIDFEKFKI